MSRLELADLIRQLRQELNQAMTAGEGEDLRFELGPVELELTVAVERSAEAGGRVRFWVLDVNADASRASSVTQRMHLTLDPRLSHAPGERALIEGQVLPGER